jgi:hypothetical protein
MAFGARDIKAAISRIETQLTILTTSTLTSSTLTALSSAIDQGIERLAIAISGNQNSINGAQESINARISAVNTRIEAVNSDINALRYSVQTAADAQEIRRDVAELHALIAEWKAEAAEARRLYEAANPPPEPADEPPTEPARTDEPSHSQLLRTAASISSATLTCHRDLWAFFVERSAAGRHFRVPGLVKKAGDGKVEVELSGRTIIASLTALDQVRREHERDEDEDWALASELYEAFADVVEAVGQGPRSGTEGEVAIVIDRKSPSEPVPTADEAEDDNGQGGEGPGEPSPVIEPSQD